MAYDLLGNDGPIVGDDIMGEMLEGDDIMGDDIMGDGRGRNRMMAARAAGIPTRRPALINRLPGVSPPAIGRLPLGFGSLSCSAGTNPSGGSLTARPQVPWRGAKLIIGIVGTNAGNYGVAMRPSIGNRPVLAGAGTIDARAFPSDGINNDLISESASVGIDVTFDFVITPNITGGDTVIIQPTWIGDATV